MRIFISLVFCVALSAPLRAGDATRGRISVDWNDTRQTIVGFGGTMGWIHPHAKDREKVFDLLFEELGVSVLRIRALGGEGGDELSLEPANDNDDPAVPEWSKFPIVKTEARNAIIMKEARKRGVATIIPTSWSPPGWMKDTNRRAGGGRLKPDMYAEYAELWIAYVRGMKREFDIDIGYVSIQNEPDLTYYYPTCSFTAEVYAASWAAVQSRFKKEKLDVRVIGPDTCRIYNMPSYAEALVKKGYTEGLPLLTHLYDLSIDFARVERDAERWRAAGAVAGKLKRPLWLMETANYLSTGAGKGSYEEALVWAQKIHYALVEGNCEVVCYWSLFFDKEGEALIYCPESESREIKITPKYYTSKHFYRFVRPGMVRCSASCAGGKVLVSAFRSKGDGGGARVVVLINPGTTPARAVLPWSSVEGWQCFRTSRTVSCRSVGLEGSVMKLPSGSVTTLVRRGADVATDPPDGE